MSPRLWITFLAMSVCALAVEPDTAIHHIITLKNGSLISAIGYADKGDSLEVTIPLGKDITIRKVPKRNILLLEKWPISYREDEKPAGPYQYDVTLLDLSTDPTRYLDQEITVKNAVLKVSTYFNYSYKDARSTHICFNVADGTASGFVYVEKSWEHAEMLRQRILREGGVKGDLTIVIRSEKYDSQSSDVMAEFMALKQ